MAIKDKQALAAKRFVNEWSGKGYEKGETQRFWLSLLHNVFGVDDPTKVMRFELPVKTFTKDKGADFIDAYIITTKVLIEQKGSHVNLEEKEKQSDGMMLTPYQQAHRANDAAVLEAYGFPKDATESEIVARLFKMYQELTKSGK